MTFRMAMIVLLAIPVGIADCAVAQLSSFHAGPVIKEFGKIAAVESDLPIPAETRFRIVFDMAKKAGPGSLNRTLDTAARFINMHVDAGVPAGHIALAIVVHGGASEELTRDAFYKEKNNNQTNFSAQAIATLRSHGVQFYLCGQSAVAHGIGKEHLLPGVKMALSAMTAHALLLQAGYTPNPF